LSASRAAFFNSSRQDVHLISVFARFHRASASWLREGFRSNSFPPRENPTLLVDSAERIFRGLRMAKGMQCETQTKWRATGRSRE